MIQRYIERRTWNNRNLDRICDNITDSLIKSRNFFDVQKLSYELLSVCSVDLDPTGNFLLIGLSNGIVDLQSVDDYKYGTLEGCLKSALTAHNLHRVQWSPSDDEQFFSILDHHNLILVDPCCMRKLETISFNMKTNWSEWNPRDRKMIAVCGSGSQARLVDIRSGSSAQTIILTAKSGLPSHRPTRCLWSGQDLHCLIIGDNEGYMHIYDTRQSSKPLVLAGDGRGQVSGMSFTSDQCSIITSHGTENNLVQWYLDKGSLRQCANKFKKQPKVIQIDDEQSETQNEASTSAQLIRRYAVDRNPAVSVKRAEGAKRALAAKKRRDNHNPLPVNAYLRCQFYVSDRHVFCPVPSRVKKSKEIYVYDVESGFRIKTLKSNDILCQGVHCVTGLSPSSLVLYVGGRGRLRVWTIDEDYQRKMDEEIRQFHVNHWDSD